MGSRGSVPRKCEQCGVGFLARSDSVRIGAGKLCSRRCRDLAQTLVVDVTCGRAGCTAVFKVKPSRAARGGGKYCSSSCQHAASVLATDVVCARVGCGAVFKTIPSRAALGFGKYCSVGCRSEPWPERFWSRVNKDTRSGCWEWTLGRYDAGYGFVKEPGKTSVSLAHRVSWELAFGPIGATDKDCVLHSCDNPPCVRPSHLFLGSRRDNYVDAAGKGRNTRGELVGTHKLTENDICSIREKKLRGTSSVELAKEFGVSLNTVHRVITRRTWRHVQ